MNQSTPKQRRQIMAIIYHLDIADMKEKLVLDYTYQRTTSLREMTFEEAMDMIKSMNAKQMTPDTYSKMQKSDRMRKRILSMCHQLSWTYYDKNQKKQTVSFYKLDAWMMNYSYLHKLLNSYKDNELPRLVHQFEEMFLNYLNKV